MEPAFDIVVVGAGMAGASLAATVCARAKALEVEGSATGPSILMLEAEDHPGYHATGRSAAFWTESYGGAEVQPLTAASGPVLHELGVLKARGALTMGRAEDAVAVNAFAEEFTAVGVKIEQLARPAMELHVAGLRDPWVHAALEPSTCDIDVAGLHQFYLANAQRDGVALWCRAGLAKAQRLDGGWQLTLTDGRTVRAGILVNAAGAWADIVADLAGVRCLGITPYRRTVAQLAVEGQAPDNLPLVLDVGGTFYFKPESGRLWLSPHDETPSLPCDAAPEEIDVALAIDRFEGVVDYHVTRVEHRWAGLRSFAPDRLPVYGFDPADPTFFWFAGQGGFGIQTAPAAAELAARLLLGEEQGQIDPAPYAPSRF